MINKQTLPEVIITITLLALLILLLNPFDFWMPSMMLNGLILSLLIFAGIFVGIVWKEKPKDEREALHKHHAGSLGYLVGIGILTIAIIVQSIEHTLDTWLLIAFAGMIITKTITRIYNSTLR